MTYTESAPVSVSLTLEGVWIHDPADPAGTAVNLRYGRADRTAGVGVEWSATHYAGRKYPVMDFGESESEDFRARCFVPFGPGYVSTLDAVRELVRRRVLLAARDGRGRSVTGALVHDEADTDAGTMVSVAVIRGDA